MVDFPGELASTEYCYLTTTGRRSGEPHTVEIWFGVLGVQLCLIGGHSDTDWLANLRRRADVSVRIGLETRLGQAVVVSDPLGRQAIGALLAAKYELLLEPPDVADTAGSWAYGATAVAIGGWR
jgi:hypothetical protein